MAAMGDARQQTSASMLFVCWAIGVVIATTGLWFWLDRPPIGVYATFLAHSNAWLLVGGVGGATFGMAIFGLVFVWSRRAALQALFRPLS